MPDDNERHGAPEHVTAPPAAGQPPGRAAYGPDQRAADAPPAGAAWPRSRSRCLAGTGACLVSLARRLIASRRLVISSESVTSASERSSCLRRRSAFASTRQAPHAATWAFARSSSAPLSSPSTRADSWSPRWLTVPAPADPVPVREGRAQLGPAPVDTTAHGAELYAHGRRDLLVRKAFDVAEHHRRPVVRGKRLQRRLDVPVEVVVVPCLRRRLLGAGDPLLDVVAEALEPDPLPAAWPRQGTGWW